MNKQIAIFAVDYKQGVEFLKNLIGEMKYKDVKYFVLRPTASAVLTNGDRYKVLPYVEAIRGHKWNTAIVSRKIPLKFIQEVIEIGFYVNEDNPQTDMIYFNE